MVAGFSAQGNTLVGRMVTPGKVQCVSTLNQLEAFGLLEPVRVQKATDADAKASPKLAEARKILSNRVFNKARCDRAVVYSQYIENVETGKQIGGTPAITLWIRDPVEVNETGVVIPYTALLCAIDGQTQVQARFLLRERLPQSGAWPVAVTLYAGVSLEVANQVLHDYNKYASPVDSREGIRFNHVGGLSRSINEAMHLAGMTPRETNLRGMLPTKSYHAVSSAQIAAFIAGSAIPSIALKQAVFSYYDELNDVNTTSRVPKEAASAVEALIKECRSGSAARTAPPVIWQVAGAVLAASGFTHSVSDLDFDAASKARDALLASGKEESSRRGVRFKGVTNEAMILAVRDALLRPAALAIAA